MSIPQFDSDGFLPECADPYAVSINEMYELCVNGEPNQDHREQIFSAFIVHANKMRSLGFDRVWANGGFVTRKAQPPKDIDLVYPASSDEHLAMTLETPGIEQLITHNGIITHSPMSRAFKRMQPMGGLVDATVCSPRKFDYWRQMWGTIKVNDREVDYSRRKGFLEVGLR